MSHRPPSVARLAAWIQNRLGTEKAESRQMAQKMRQVFRKGTVITDWDVPDKPTRAILYRLYRAGLVETHTIEQPRPEDGRLWRYHHWILSAPGGLPGGARAQKRSTVPDPYRDLPKEAWHRPAEEATA